MLFVTKHTLEYRRDIILENPVLFQVLVRNTTVNDQGMAHCHKTIIFV